jgi:hypothetical protein
MVSRDVATLFMVHMPDDEVRSLRDSIAKAEAELTAPVWVPCGSMFCPSSGFFYGGPPGTSFRLMNKPLVFAI